MYRQCTAYAIWIREIPETEWNHRYRDQAWPVSEVLGHILDSERIMATRALCIARGEQQPLPGYNEDEYAEHTGYQHLSPMAVAVEWEALRRSTLAMIRNLPDAAFTARGIANGKPVTVTAILHLLAGHAAHHVHVLQERYGLSGPEL